MSKNEGQQEDAVAYIDSFLSPEEIAESNLRGALIGELIKARNERGTTRPKISTVLKLLAPLGKKLAIVPLES